MGFIRLLLAVSVLALHCGSIFGTTFVGGTLAVQAFYIISGFYMALVLESKYDTLSWKGYKLFITNRLLKLYPIYWLTLLAILLLGVVSYKFLNSNYIFSYYIDNSDLLTPLNTIIFFISNVFIVGQDLLFFVGYDEAGYYFQRSYKDAEVSLHRFLFLKQAWTIGLEIYFYALVPFINRLKNNKIILIVIALFALRALGYYLGYKTRPWSCQFFPFELAFFLIGVLAYRMYRQHTQKILALNISKYVFLFIVVITVSYPLIGVNTILTRFSYLFVFACAMPFVFSYSKDLKWDRYIGETSYPIYITHMLIALLLSLVVSKQNVFYGFLVFIISFVVSLIFNEVVLRNIEKYRQKRVLSKA